MDAYFIVGTANTRKSSVLRSLTGCFNRNNREIALIGGGQLAIYARVSSLQESETTPQDFIIEASATGQTTTIFCLWPHAHPDPAKAALYPNAHAYLAKFISAGWSFQACAVLGTSTIVPATPRVGHFLNVPSLPINLGAQAVRSHFGWQ